MILELLFGLSLVLNVSLDTQASFVADPSAHQKDALLPLVRQATDCIVQGIGRSSYSTALHPGEINELIADTFAACVRPVRAMIDDRMYGSGSGEAC